MHQIDTHSKGKASMAYVGEVPWHGLGQQLTEGASIERWTKEAGFDYEVLSGSISITPEGKGKPIAYTKKQGLYRSDTLAPLAVVGDRYKVLQPSEVLEFFRDLTEERGFVIETAGVLFGGARYWALARTPHELILPGNDKVKEHLMLATACDGSMASIGKYVRTRTVCWNTVAAALGERGTAVRVEHRSQFNGENVKRELGLVDQAWEKFADDAKLLARTRVDEETAAQYIIDLVGEPDKDLEEQTAPTVQLLLDKFTTGDFLGSGLKAAKGTLWGLCNVVTEHVDHHVGRIQDRRLKSAWFGKGATLKQNAFANAVKIAHGGD